MARRERTEATVRRTARRLRALEKPLPRKCDSKRRDAHEHGGRMRGGWAARGERCAASSAWAAGGAARKRLPRLGERV